jgi:hypothetical protein
VWVPGEDQHVAQQLHSLVLLRGGARAGRVGRQAAGQVPGSPAARGTR